MRWTRIAAGLAGLLLSGCMLAAARDDQAARSMLAAPRGHVRVVGGDGAPVVVALLRAPEREGCPLQVVDFVQVFGERADWELTVAPGRYRLVAFEDRTRDLGYDAGERVVPWDSFREFTLTPGTREGLDLVIEGPPPSIDERMPEVLGPTAELRGFHVGEVRSLDDPRMGAEAARVGVWEPQRFVDETGPGLFFLEPYDPERTPVIVVHGISGHPQEFRALIARLDRRRFQVWPLSYPSGWQVDRSAAHLARSINELDALHGLPRVCIVAHSMGGLVARRALAQLGAQADGDRPHVRALVTIASPLGGLPLAGAAVAVSPVVVDAWRSLAPHGALLTSLYGASLPDETRYALLFAYRDGQGTDGVVPLTSQLRVEAQEEADLVRGVVATHGGVLLDDGALDVVERELERCHDGP